MTPLARYLAAMRLLFQNRDSAIDGGLPLLARAFQALKGSLLGELAGATKRGELTVAMLPDLEQAMRAGFAGGWPAVEEVMMGGLRQRWQEGMMLPDLGMAAIGRRRPPAPPADAALARTVAAFAADRVTFLEQAAMSAVTRFLHLGVLGHMSPSYVQNQISGYLDLPERSGPGFPGELWKQAERVWRTESMNMFNGAAAERLRDLESKQAGWRKMWNHGGRPMRPRPYHLSVLHGQVIPVASEFTVMDEKGHTYLAFGPHDPRLPASETIQCGCSLVSVPPGMLPVTVDRGMMDSLRQRQGKYQADWIKANRPDLAETPEGQSWVNEYRPEAVPFL